MVGWEKYRMVRKTQEYGMKGWGKCGNQVGWEMRRTVGQGEWEKQEWETRGLGEGHGYTRTVSQYITMVGGLCGRNEGQEDVQGGRDERGRWRERNVGA